MSIKIKEETYEKLIEMSKNNDYTTGNLLDHDYFSNHYKLIVIDLSKQIELETMFCKNKLILLVSLKKMIEKQCFSSMKNQKKQFFNFSVSQLYQLKTAVKNEAGWTWRMNKHFTFYWKELLKQFKMRQKNKKEDF